MVGLWRRKVTIQQYNGIKSLYKFNAGSGNTLYDHSGNANHGTINDDTWVENIYGCTDFNACNYQPYYYVLSNSSDVIITPGLTFNEGPIISADYRKLRSKGSIFVKGSFTRGSIKRTDETESNKMRGHINIKAIERLNNEWIAGMNIIRASDATYLSRYGLEKKQSGNLTQRVHLSGQDDGFYSEIESLYFQPMDSSKSNRHVPLILPNIKTIWTKQYGDGNYREIAFNATSIARATGSNSQRVTLQSKWVKGTILESGHLIEARLSGRADLYRDRKTDRSKTSGDLGSH